MSTFVLMHAYVSVKRAIKAFEKLALPNSDETEGLYATLVMAKKYVERALRDAELRDFMKVSSLEANFTNTAQEILNEAFENGAFKLWPNIFLARSKV